MNSTTRTCSNVFSQSSSILTAKSLPLLLTFWTICWRCSAPWPKPTTMMMTTRTSLTATLQPQLLCRLSNRSLPATCPMSFTWMLALTWSTSSEDYSDSTPTTLMRCWVSLLFCAIKLRRSLTSSIPMQFVAGCLKEISSIWVAVSYQTSCWARYQK